MARSLLSRTDDLSRLTDRVRALGEAADLCAGRVEPALVDEAQRVSRQVDRRLAVSGAATVVALAGATGSGKSSLFNVLSGTDLADVGVRRPTTAYPLAATWGRESVEDLLDWLGVPRRHGISSGLFGSDLDGLVLLDLPDHDSTEVAHRLEVDRLVKLVDVMIWVVDPQKYADAALHDRYLKPLAQHAEVMLVVLNQIDRLPSAERAACVADLRRLLASEGLGGLEVIATSAETEEGVDELRTRLVAQVADKQAAARRLAADVAAAASGLSAGCGTATTTGIAKSSVQRMNAAIADGAGIGVVTDAVRDAWRLRGGLATGWPVLSWLAKFRPDPLRRLHLDRLPLGRGPSARPKEIDPTDVGRSSLPATTGVQRARVESALRRLADDTGQGLARGWIDAITAAARSHQESLPDALDRAIAATDLDLSRHRRWWQLIRVLQWVLVAALAAGLLWLATAFVLVYLQLPPLPPVTWWGLPAPTVLTLGGALAGVLVAGVSRLGVEVGARRRELVARRALNGSIARVTAERVIAPVQAELVRYDQARAAIRTAGGV